MNDLKSIAAAADRLRRTGEPFLVATVVHVHGSSYRRPGARLLLTRERWVAGSISGGCLEDDLVKKAWWRTRHGGPALVTYDARSADTSLGEVGFAEGVAAGLGCNGIVDVLIEPERAGQVEPLSFAEGCFRAQHGGALATVFRGPTALLGAHAALTSDGAIASDGMDAETRRCLTEHCFDVLTREQSVVVRCVLPDGPIEALVEAVLPPPRLFVCGAGHDALPVVKMAAAVGWESVVWQPHSRWLSRERFGRAQPMVVGSTSDLALRVNESHRPIAVVMGHDYERDRACLAALLPTRARYVGVLGPRRRTLQMLDEIGMQREDSRIHAPAGLSLGAETPEEIALAIVAEAQSVLTRTSAASLRDNAGPIHSTPHVSSRAAE